MLGIQHWPQVLWVASLAISFAIHCAKAGEPRHKHDPVAFLVAGAVDVTILAYGGFWAVWGMVAVTASAEARSGGISVAGLLGVLFVGLKLTGTIDWSWWWVLAPFWVPPVLYVVIVCIIGFLLFIAEGQN